MDTYTTRHMSPTVRVRWIYDPEYQAEGSFAYDTEAETQAAVDETNSKLESGEWVALGAIVEHQCDKCEQWHEKDSLWGIVIAPNDAELDEFARHSLDLN